jgi:hypothetical protein
VYGPIVNVQRAWQRVTRAKLELSRSRQARMAMIMSMTNLTNTGGKHV